MLDLRGIVIVSAVAALSIALSTMSYQSAAVTSGEVVKTAASNIKANTDAQAYYLSRIVSNKVRSVYENLQILASGPAVQKGDYQTPTSLFAAAESSTEDLTDYYMWVNEEGRIVQSSNMIQATYEHPVLNQSGAPIFAEPMRSGAAYFSNLTQTGDGVKKLYVSYPILYSLTDNADKVGRFKGVVTASINLDTLGALLQTELNPGLNTKGLALLDNSGVVIYANDKSLIGKNAFAGDDQSIFSSPAPPDEIERMNGIVRASLGSEGSKEIVMDGQTHTLAFRPITHNGNQLWTLFVWSPHDFASNVDDLVNRQNNFGILMIVIIGAITIGAAYVVLTWNGRLAATVSLRTEELRNSNTRLEQLNVDLSQANERLQVHNKMQEEFVNVAAHELRTPIMPIIALTDIIESSFKDKEKITIERSEFDILSRNARRLERLSTDILDTTRIESHSLKLNKEVFNLDDAISVAVEDARHQAANAGSNATISYRPSNIRLKADRARITQLILSLLSNAVKFTPQGSVSISAKATEEGFAVVSVKDTGTGIDPEILPRLFAKFATKSHPDGPQTGTGLGLFIAKSIVDAHGGRIWAENNNGERGATFTFTLPLHDIAGRISSQQDSITEPRK